MVQLQILCGSRRGAGFCGARFPIRVGRAPDSDLCVEEPGVWPRHFHILWEPEGLLVEAEAEALLELNGVAAQRASDTGKRAQPGALAATRTARRRRSL